MVVSYPSSIKSELRREFQVDWTRFDPIARIEFTISDEEINLGTLPALTRTSVPVRVFSQKANPESADPDLTAIRAGFESLAFINAATSRRIIPAADGSFAADGMFPSRFYFGLDADSLPEGWYVASAMSGTGNLLNDLLVIRGAAVDPIAIILADDGARVEGVAQNAVDDPVAARVVLIPPVNRRGPYSMFPTAMADTSGAFVIERVPPANYRILAIDEAGFDRGATYWQSPDFLRRYEIRGEAVTVDPGARIVISPEAILLNDWR
jgi:hypothetical protein